MNEQRYAVVNRDTPLGAIYYVAPGELELHHGETREYVSKDLSKCELRCDELRNTVENLQHPLSRSVEWPTKDDAWRACRPTHIAQGESVWSGAWIGARAMYDHLHRLLNAAAPKGDANE